MITGFAFSGELRLDADGAVWEPATVPQQIFYTYTRAGRKIHITEDLEKTLCGFDVWQLLLVEGHPRREVICEWCSSA